MGGFSLGSVGSYCKFIEVSFKSESTAYERYVNQAILYGSEAWCLKESEIEIF